MYYFQNNHKHTPVTVLHMTTWILTTILKFVSKSIRKYIKQSPHCLLKLLINYAQRSVPYSVNNIKSGLNISIVGS
jgi:hypothetical protein